VDHRARVRQREALALGAANQQQRAFKKTGAGTGSALDYG